MTNQANTAVQAKAPAKRKKLASLDRRKARAGWLFVLPFLIGFVIIYLPMIFESIQFSFSKIHSEVGGYTLEMVGFKNYKDALLVLRL